MKEKLRKLREAKGITLVALIITIILLIILAAITIRVALNGKLIEFTINGAINYAEAQGNELGDLNNTESKIKDIEELFKDNLGSAEGQLRFSDLTWTSGKASTTIHKKEDNEYKIEYRIIDKNGNEVQGYKEIAEGGAITELELGSTVIARLFNDTEAGTKYSTGTASITVTDLGKPEVTVTEGTVTTKSITVTVAAIDREAGMPSNPEYTYYIKKSTDVNYPADKKQTKTQASCTFDNLEKLEQNVSYEIKVEVKDIAGNTGTGTLTGITTAEVPSGTGDGTKQGAIAFENLSWNNYKASVTIKKTISENYTIKYRVVDKDNKETVTEREIASGQAVENLNLGDMVIARLTDGVNYGNTASITVTDLDGPTAPTFGTVTGTKGTNGWYKTAVTVPIVPGTDAESGVLKTTYIITGAGEKEETEGTRVEISEEGESTITAYTYDKAINKTASATKTIKIDTENPNTATTTYISHDITTITVKTTAQDTLSGLAKVEYQYSTDGTNYTTKDKTDYTGTTEVTTNNSYTFSKLNDNTKYWLRVKVTDMAGRETEGTAITQITKKGGLNASELAIGKYVAYQPDTPDDATYSTYQDGEERSGGGNQTISRDTSLTWRIMNVSGNTLTLIATTPASGGLMLYGANGYNNGVKLLNDACNQLYKNVALGAIGRNMNVEDVKTLTGYSYTESNNPITPTANYYPSIFINEKHGTNGSTYGQLGQSEQDTWYTGSSNIGTLKGCIRYFSYNTVSSTTESALITGHTGNQGYTNHTAYWLASRSVGWDRTDDEFDFGLFRVTGGICLPYELYLSYGQEYKNVYYRGYTYRPCIELDLSKIFIGTTGTGDDATNAYSIQAR